MLWAENSRVQLYQEKTIDIGILIISRDVNNRKIMQPKAIPIEKNYAGYIEKKVQNSEEKVQERQQVKD